jgi:hypothetical protein
LGRAASNLIDAVSRDDRLRVLAEVRRVLRSRAVFALSSHNRRFRAALSGPILRWSPNPATQVMHAVRYIRSLINHKRVGRLRRIEDAYAVLSDSGHDYALLHYYVDRDRQLRQLQQAGFRLLEAFDVTGRALGKGDDDRDSPSVLYAVARED